VGGTILLIVIIAFTYGYDESHNTLPVNIPTVNSEILTNSSINIGISLPYLGSIPYSTYIVGLFIFIQNIQNMATEMIFSTLAIFIRLPPIAVIPFTIFLIILSVNIYRFLFWGNK